MVELEPHRRRQRGRRRRKLPDGDLLDELAAMHPARHVVVRHAQSATRTAPRLAPRDLRPSAVRFGSHHRATAVVVAARPPQHLVLRRLFWRRIPRRRPAGRSRRRRSFGRGTAAMARRQRIRPHRTRPRGALRRTGACRMNLRSTLYAGIVTHRRLRPRPHRLRYRASWMLLDLDEIGRLPRRLRLFSHNRFNALSFFDADHGDGSGRPLRDQVEGHLQAAGLATDGGAIRLFCMPRIFGYGFNPLSVYFCYQRDGSLAAILYEVHNTFRERHSYLIPVERDAGAAGVAGAPGAVIDQHCRKDFYVSPFMDMDMNYTFRVAVPDQRVMIAIRAADQDGLLLAAALTGERSALTDLAVTVMNTEGWPP